MPVATPRTILLCTVGGSHQPILKAIRSVAPDFVCFFCTGRDPATGKVGSIRQVKGKGNVIGEGPDSATETLPNIPSQAELKPGSFEVSTVPADDLDDCFQLMRTAIFRLTELHPEAKFVADYTGGTKTMSAALVCAVLETDGVDLQLIRGARFGLGVAPSTTYATPTNMARLRLERAMAPFLDAWERFAYREAAFGLDRLLKRNSVAFASEDLPRLQVAHALSHGLAQWDDFNHTEALARIEPFAARITLDHPAVIPDLRLLQKTRDSRNEPARIYDLWLNAKRRAAQGRYDDAVARVYRLMEWTAQWQLRSKLSVDTGNIPAEWLPPDSRSMPDRDGKIRIGLRQAWQVVRERVDGPAGEFIFRHENELLDRLQVRNQSILAHGFQPVGADEWQCFNGFIEDRFQPMFRELASDAGLKSLPRQLPTQVPAFILPTS